MTARTFENKSEDPSCTCDDGVTKFMDDVGSALDVQQLAYDHLQEASARLCSLIERAIAAWVYPSAIVDFSDRDLCRRVPIFSSFSVLTGRDYGSLKFRIDSAPQVRLHPTGEPSLSRWECAASPISTASGKVLAQSEHLPQTRIAAQVFALDDEERFMDFIAQSEQQRRELASGSRSASGDVGAATDPSSLQRNACSLSSEVG